MRASKLISLIGKDLRLHGRGILLAQSGFLLLILLLTRILSKSVPGYSAVARATFVYNMNFLSASFVWGDWLISREKTKGTFAWLRSMPVSDRTIVRSKLVLGCACCALLWMTSSGIFSSTFFVPARWALWCLILMGLLCFTVLSFTTRLILKQKAGVLVPIGVAAALLLPIFGSTYFGVKSFVFSSSRLTPSVEWACCAALCLLTALVWGFLEAWMRFAETPQLLE